MEIRFFSFLYDKCGDISITVIDINLSISENLDIIFIYLFMLNYIPVALIKPTGMGTLANFVWFTGAVISPFLNYNTNIRNNQCKVQTCIKSSDMVIELETSSAELKYRIKIVLNFGHHFVNGNYVDMSYLHIFTTQ